MVYRMGGAAHALSVFRSDDRSDHTAFKKSKPEIERRSEMLVGRRRGAKKHAAAQSVACGGTCGDCACMSVCENPCEIHIGTSFFSPGVDSDLVV